ncbi:hypothetical protein MRS76_25745 [Rhizobiaceae bacterium n13]|nr:hypothetical protein [Fererhizobium litorale]MDI7865300.1 hypothetical protein [Fererhizobium litorale]
MTTRTRSRGSGRQFLKARRICGQTIRDEALDALRTYVAGMNLDNFIVRGKRRAVEKYKDADAWKDLTDAVRDELLDEIAPLPSEVKGEAEEAKRFDLLIFGLELALLKGSKSFDRLKKRLIEIASALDEQTAIPIIAAQHPLILDILSETGGSTVTAANSTASSGAGRISLPCRAIVRQVERLLARNP